MVGNEIAKHLDSLPDQPAFATENYSEALEKFDLGIDEKKFRLEELTEYLFQQAIPCSFNTASPGYLAYIPGGGLPQSAISDLIASATNRYMGVWAAAPCLATIGQNVIRWMCDLFELGRNAGGILTTGGSLANWTAMVTARNKLLGEEFLDGVLYCSDQSHHCIEKAARLCGIRPSNIRKVKSDTEFRIDTNQLVSEIEKDKADGLRPFFVVGNAGTTNSGAVDQLPELSKICQDFGTWFHVDAAYGGFFAMTERGKRVLSGIEFADSVVVDPHKGLFLPYGTGALLVRDVKDLRDTHRVDADYLPDYQDDQNRTDFHEISPELSRDFRGLRIWLPLKIHGTEVFRENLEEKLRLTDWIYDQLNDWNGESTEIECLTSPCLSIVTFRAKFEVADDRGDDSSIQDRLNQELLGRINAKKRVYLTSTLLNGRFVIRICVLSFRTHRKNLEHCWEDICQAVGEMEAELRPNPIAD